MNIHIMAVMMSLPVFAALIAIIYWLRSVDTLIYAMVVMLTSSLAIFLLLALTQDLRDQKIMRKQVVDEVDVLLNSAEPYRKQASVIDAQCQVVGELSGLYLAGCCRYRRLSAEIDLLRELITERSTNE